MASSATKTNVAQVTSSIVTQIPAHAVVPPATMNSLVVKLINDLDAEAVAAATWAAQLKETASLVKH